MKIENKDFRIGNYVNCPNKLQNPFRIDGFEFLGKKYFKAAMIGNENYHPLTWNNEYIEPIQLTGEWLEDFGFTKTLTVAVITTNYRLDNFLFNSAIFWKCQYKNELIERNILYVHELQNLYYMITGNELVIKNK